MRILWWLGIFICSSLFAQDDLHVIRYYDRNDGLSNSGVYLIYEDSRRFLWLSTREGLNRFDGHSFKSYFQNNNQAEGLPHNLVYDILEYEPGLLLLATGNGIAVLNTITDEFENKRVLYTPLAAGQGAEVANLFKDNQGLIWVNYEGNTDRLDKQLRLVDHLSEQPWAHDLKGALIKAEGIIIDQHNQVWIPTDTSGIQIINFEKREIYNDKNNPGELEFLKFKFVRSMLLDEAEQTLLISPWGIGLHKFNLKDGTHQSQLFGLKKLTEESCINALLPLDDHKVLCTVGGKSSIINTIDLSVRQIPSLSSTAEFEGANNVFGYSIIQSSDHQYWIASSMGLIQLSDQKVQSGLVLFPDGANTSCNSMLLASTGKIYSLYTNFKLVETEHDRKTFKVYSLPALAAGATVTTLEENVDGLIWVGTTKGLITFDPVDKKFGPSPFPISDLTFPYINVLYLDKNKKMWIGTRDEFRLYQFDNTQHAIQEINNEVIREFASVSKRTRVTEITEDKNGNYWMRSLLGGGILEYTPKNGQWNNYPGNNSALGPLQKKGIMAFYADDHGNLWISSVAGGGLIKYNLEKNEINLFDRKDGILSDIIQTITPDNKGNIWLTTEYGVSGFNLTDEKVVSNILFSKSLFADHVIFDPLSNKLILSLDDRFHFISTSAIRSFGEIPQPIIDGVWVNNEKINWQENNASLRLKQDQKNIAIQFTAPYFGADDKLQFAYQLQGADDSMKLSDASRKAQYAVLSPGKYSFHLKVGDDQQHWGEEQEMFAFTIVPPFWRTWWFAMLSASAIGLSIFWISKMRIKQVQKEAALRQQMSDTEMMALRAQMNPHFIFNSLNSIDALIHNNDKYQATMYLNKFAKLIRNILDSSKQNTISVAKDLENIRLYIDLEKMRSENSFTEEIHVDPVILQEDLRVPPLIMQPYVENAILHGLRNRADDLGQLKISIERKNGHLHYLIEDNGVGRKQAMNGRSKDKTSYGMQMSSDRIKLFNHEDHASVRIIDLEHEGMPAGTRVEIRLNLK